MVAPGFRPLAARDILPRVRAAAAWS